MSADESCPPPGMQCPVCLWVRVRPPCQGLGLCSLHVDAGAQYMVLHWDVFTCFLSGGACPGRKRCCQPPTLACQPNVLG